MSSALPYTIYRAGPKRASRSTSTPPGRNTQPREDPSSGDFPPISISPDDKKSEKRIPRYLEPRRTNFVGMGNFRRNQSRLGGDEQSFERGEISKAADSFCATVESFKEQMASFKKTRKDTRQFLREKRKSVLRTGTQQFLRESRRKNLLRKDSRQFLRERGRKNNCGIRFRS